MTLSLPCEWCKAVFPGPARAQALAPAEAARYQSAMPHNPLFRHLDEVGESYAEHSGHAAAFGLRMIGGGLACLVHAVLPFLFERAGSDTVRALHKTLCKRTDRPNWERHPII